MQYLVIRYRAVVDGLEVQEEGWVRPRVDVYVEGRVVEPTTVDDTGADVVLGYEDHDVAHDTARLRIGDQDHDLRSGVFANFLAPDPTEAAPLSLIAQPSTDQPFQSTFQTRIRPADATARAMLPIGGTPCDQNIPVNAVASKEVNNFLDPSGNLHASTKTATGFLREYETYWEPLGWAMDEWIDTLSLAPFEDTVVSTVDISSDGSAESDATTTAKDRSAGATSSEGSVKEKTGIEASSAASGRGFHAGIGTPSPGTAPLSINSLASLAQFVTGAAQVGYSSSTISGANGARGDVQREVANRIEQSASIERLQNAAALARSVGKLRESRQLRALRNLAGGSAVNLALFSVVKQWLVTTVEARTRPVLFVRVNKVDVPFEARDVFLHRDVLLAVLRDSTLDESVAECATTYVPHAGTTETHSEDGAPAEGEDWLATAQLVKVVGNAVVTDPAKGRGSHVLVRAVFRDPVTGRDDALTKIVDATERGQPVAFELEIDRPLERLVGWSFEYDNPGATWHKHAELSSVRLVAHIESASTGETKRRELAVDLPSTVAMLVDEPRRFVRSIPVYRRSTGHHEYHPADRARLLEHLNANRAYYRLAIDLQRDPATRFVELSKRLGEGPFPADMRPVGVAGVHLAFLFEGPSTSSGDAPAPITRLVSTPAGGTFMQVAEGCNHVAAATGGPGWPSVVVGENGSITWPAPVQLTAPASTSQTLPDAAPKAPETVDTGPSELLAKLETALKSIDTLNAALKEQQDAAKAATPTPADRKDPAAETPAPQTPAAGT
ncbi:MAG TPA: hypothetical protein VGC84_07740 [Ilumatobacteraceae bacterium]